MASGGWDDSDDDAGQCPARDDPRQEPKPREATRCRGRLRIGGSVENRAGKRRDPSGTEDPEGGVPKSDAQRRSGAKRRWEGGTTRVPGDGGARSTARTRAGRNSTSSQTQAGSVAKGWRMGATEPDKGTVMYNLYMRNTGIIILCFVITHAPSESAPERDGRESGGRGRPAADGRAGPFRPERTPFFPSLLVR